MNYEIIDNVLPEENFDEIKNTILSSSFPWSLTTIVTQEGESLPINASYYFTHEFWNGFNVSPQSQMFANLMNIIECKSVLRIKGNLYPCTGKVIHHDNHCDYEFEHKGAILYLNTNNGLTILEDKIEVESVENRLLLFDPSKPHRSTTCSDSQCRINVNFNFF